MDCLFPPVVQYPIFMKPQKTGVILRMRKKAIFTVLVLMAALVASFGFAEEYRAKARPGETVTVPVVVQANPEQAVAALLKLEYDHDVLELVPSDFVQADTILLADLDGIRPGEAGQVSFVLNPEAEKGVLDVRFSTVSARNLDEKAVSGPETGTAAVIVAKAKKPPENQYYSNGAIKKEVVLNSVGNPQQIRYFNRFGGVTRTEESEAWDADGNILRETDYYPYDKSTVHYTYSYTYDVWGNTLSSELTYKEDGTLRSKTENEYDEYDRRIRSADYDEKGEMTGFTVYEYGEGKHTAKITYFNAKGEITGFRVDYLYDENDHLISYRSLKADGQTASFTENTWTGDIQVESRTTDPDGNVISQNVRDPVFGDTLISIYTDDDGHRNASFYTYYEDTYETDSRYYGMGYRYVTLYAADERRIKEVSYSAERDSDSWTEDRVTVYSTDESGNTVSETRGADGSMHVSVENGNGDTIRDTAYKEDGSFSYCYTYEYNSKGQRIRSNRLNEEGTVESYEITEYNSKGEKSKSITWKGDGSFFYGSSYEYDGKGQRIRENSLNEDGTINSFTLSEYDASGNAIRRTRYRADGTVSGFDEYEYDESGYRTHYVSYKGDGTKSYEYFYRTLEDGTYQSKSIWYNSDGSVREDNDWE